MECDKKQLMKNITNNVPVVDFHRVQLRYEEGTVALKNVQFSLERGSFHFVTGDSGAGKTSLLRLMYLDQRATGGRVSLFGYDLSALKRSQIPFLRRKIGVVFQDFRLIDSLNTFDNVALPLRIMGMRETEIKKRVMELLGWVGLEKCAGAIPSTLSGGEKQRVAIARAVINAPDLLLADEPTGNVDDMMARRILHLFLELNKMGTTLVIATHNQGLIRQFKKPCLHLSNGELECFPAPIDANKASADLPPSFIGEHHALDI